MVSAAIPFAMGAKGGCGPIDSTEAAPDVTGNWAVQYDSTMTIDVTIEGAVYHQTLPAAGGMVAITHKGVPLTFNVDCARPEVVCPSELWPTQVAIDQHDAMYPHRMWVQIPLQQCSGTEQAPDPSQCGAGTLNPDCKPVCTGTVATTTTDAFGVIADDGASFDLLLGAGVASNGLNCALLGVSVAHAGLVDTGSAADNNWKATQMSGGTITTGYAGGCVWVDDSSATSKALVVGAQVVLQSGFTASHL
jgi:hypothetical protein